MGCVILIPVIGGLWAVTLQKASLQCGEGKGCRAAPVPRLHPGMTPKGRGGGVLRASLGAGLWNGGKRGVGQGETCRETQ